MNSEITKEFCRFLKEKGAYQSFKKEFIYQTDLRKSWIYDFETQFDKTKYKTDSLDSYCNSMRNKINLMSFCFKWTETDLGYTYWKKICSSWQAKCEEEINKN